MGRHSLVPIAVAVLVACLPAAPARADGDPGSDVLVNQPLFLASDAGMSVHEQVGLGDLLRAVSRSGFAVRVAIIATRSDLGAVTELWRRPRSYARFLGLELSLAYTGRLLVVMPNGLGFNWQVHGATDADRIVAGIRVGRGGAGLAEAAGAAVRRLAAAAGVDLSSAPGRAQSAQNRRAGVARPQLPGSATDTLVALVACALAGAAAAAAIARRSLRRRGLADRLLRSITAGLAALRRERRAFAGPGVALALAAIGAVAVLAGSGGSGRADSAALERNPVLDPGTPLSGMAPGFTLTNQFGRAVSLHSFRGQVVLLAFNDSECTTVCPLTTAAMLEARAMLGRAGSRVALVGVDANPAATSIEDMWSYSNVHGMLRSWDFLTGSLTQLRRVWKEYFVAGAVQHGQITHTPALFVIDPRGRRARVYITQQSYSAVDQLAHLLAQEASHLLPGRPLVHAGASYAATPAITPRRTVTLPSTLPGTTVRLGPGPSPRLYLFFATWDREITPLGGHLEALGGYASSAAARGLPSLTAVDEASVESSPSALSDFVRALPRPLAYRVAVDAGGRVADGYEVQGLPWFVLTSARGRILWYRQVATSGWPSVPVLAARVRSALARAPGPASAAAVARELAGSPAPLAALHAQADRLLGGAQALRARIRSLRGYPIVLNVWASWCAPCRTELGLFASAAARYGRRVAFLGADVGDIPADAGGFLAQHPVSYPSYQTSTSAVAQLAPIAGVPTTIYISARGKVEYASPGQYDTQGSLDGDIATYALGR